MAIWSNKENPFNQRLHEICFKNNFTYDNLLFPYDIQGLKAHCKTLHQANLINDEEQKSLSACLDEILVEFNSNKIIMNEDWEDCHSLIEAKLIEKLPNAGKKLYMARSRNDQVLSATRLYSYNKLKEIKQAIQQLLEAMYNIADKYPLVPMVGYTHTQRAMPSSVALWITSYLETILRQKDTIDNAINLNNVNVLGSAAGYGTSFDIDREFLTQELQASYTQINTLSCQLSRGQIECQTLHSLWTIMFVINRLSNDMIWLSSNEFNMINIDSSCTTGSSIMPNKRNWDPCEILRSRYHVFNGYIQQLQTIISNLFYGYNSDLQETKPAFMEGIDLVLESCQAMTILLENLTINETNMLQAFDSTVFATDIANEQVKNGKSFKDAYMYVKENLANLNEQDPLANIKTKTHLGAPGNLPLEYFKSQIEKFL